MTRYYAAGCGALIWLLATLLAGGREAWDTGLYFPAVFLGAAAFGWRYPEKSWRWGIWISIGAFLMSIVTGLISGSSFSMLPLGLIAFAIYALPLIFASWLAGFIRRKTLKA